MNANELADGILAIEERIFLTKKEHQLFQNSATMLRQQQAEIEALKQIIDANNLNQNIGQFVKPTNEPVAWIDKNTGKPRMEGFIQTDHDIPLYTHHQITPTILFGASEPVYPTVKELTDGEIQQISYRYHYTYNPDYIGFARAILKKAREK